MYLRKCRSTKRKQEERYWQLVESYRTVRGPRQRVIAYLGNISQSECVAVKQAAEEKTGIWQSRLFDENGEPDWVEVDTKRIRVGRVRDFGGYWVGLHLPQYMNIYPFVV